MFTASAYAKLCGSVDVAVPNEFAVQKQPAPPSGGRSRFVTAALFKYAMLVDSGSERSAFHP